MSILDNERRVMPAPSKPSGFHATSERRVDPGVNETNPPRIDPPSLLSGRPPHVPNAQRTAVPGWQGRVPVKR